MVRQHSLADAASPRAWREHLDANCFDGDLNYFDESLSIHTNVIDRK
jgi:hypothetical protein